MNFSVIKREKIARGASARSSSERDVSFQWIFPVLGADFILPAPLPLPACAAVVLVAVFCDGAFPCNRPGAGFLVSMRAPCVR